MDTEYKIISAREIHREFKTPEATISVLKGVNLEINRQDMAVVTGASGVGKSTLLHILGGLDKPTRGQIKIGDTAIDNMSEKELARLRTKKVGFVFQNHYLLDDFDALENVMVPLLLDGRKPAEAKQRGELLLEQVGLSNRRHHRPGALSGGEQQRVAVARALANDPWVVLADEPSGNLDTATGRKLHELLFSLNRDKSITFLIATHNEELAGQCNRRLRLVDGLVYENEKIG
ncbi:MAG: ABC transporter ATP-binding protein [Candidatus Zixiibacteriota bacterium]